MVSDAESSSLIPVKLFLAPVYRIRTETSVSFFLFFSFLFKDDEGNIQSASRPYTGFRYSKSKVKD